MARDLIFAFICTVLAGLVSEILLSSYLNWPGIGNIFAIATMGCFLLHAICKRQGTDGKPDDKPD